MPKPHVCPLCSGTGILDPAINHAMRLTGLHDLEPSAKCHGCSGTGIAWEGESKPVPATSATGDQTSVKHVLPPSIGEA